MVGHLFQSYDTICGAVFCHVCVDISYRGQPTPRLPWETVGNPLIGQIDLHDADILSTETPTCLIRSVVVLPGIGLLQQTITWYMVVGKLIVIPALGHQNKGKSSFTGSGLFVLMSQCGNNNELAHHYVPCDRLLQKAYSRTRILAVFPASPRSKEPSNSRTESIVA